MEAPTSADGRRLAVLVDGDNAQARHLHRMLEEVARYGVPTIRRIYGDWTSPKMQGWKEVLHVHAFQPVQQFRYVAGKNSTDSAMIIDAMDILYAANVEGFCLISSDSDYTRLATRMREAGKFVLGIGEEKTPKALVNACNVFVYVENLVDAQKPQRAAGRPTGRHKSREVGDLLERAFAAVEEEDGWAPLGSIGNQIRQIDPGFDPRTYGHKKLVDLIGDLPDVFEVRREKREGRGAVYVRRTE